FGGKDSPVFLRAVHTRSWASRTLEERKPTIENIVRPLLTSASTKTATPSTPEMAADNTLLYILPPFSDSGSAKCKSSCFVIFHFYSLEIWQNCRNLRN